MKTEQPAFNCLCSLYGHPAFRARTTIRAQPFTAGGKGELLYMMKKHCLNPVRAENQGAVCGGVKKKHVIMCNCAQHS